MTEGQRTSGLAVASLVLGILSLLIPFVSLILGPLAIIFGGVSISQTVRDSTLSGRGMAIAGLVLGLIGAGFWVFIALMAWVIWSFIFFA